MDKLTIINKVDLLLKDKHEVSLCYLFGSLVEGETGPLSDADFGVLLQNGSQDEARRSRLAHEITKTLNLGHVDIVLLNRIPIELAYAVITQGICIYQRDEATRVEFEAYVLGRYGDYLPVLRAQINDIVQEGDYDYRVQRYREALRRTQRTLSEIRATQ